jgi:hypothetical protein
MTFYKPEYGFTASPSPTRSIRRGRLFAGGTYFRAIDPGSFANSISVALVQDLTPAPPVGSVIVTNGASVRTYPLSWITITTSADPTTTPPTDASSVSGWDPAALRASFNDPDLEMLPRSGTPAQTDPTIPVVPVPIVDVQDTGVDDQFLSAFDTTYLSGGNGLPGAPLTASSGLEGTMIHTNFEEQHDGSMTGGYFLYEWVNNAWKAFE